MTFTDKLKKERIFFDGAMGTMLQANGLKAGELPELWNITNSETIINIHESYIRAGCNILKANTFGANRLKLSDTDFTVEQIISAGIKNAKQAAVNAQKQGSVFTALDIGPIGKLLSPLGDMEFEEAVNIFSQMVKAGVEAKADLILIETMIDTEEIKAALTAAKENSYLPVIVTFTADAKGRMLTGANIQAAVTVIESLGADALGLNCGLGPEQMKPLVKELVECASIPTIMNPNAGLPEMINGKTVYHVTPAEFASDMAQIAKNVQLIGGCCGTTPEHIMAMIASCREIPFTPAITKKK